MNSFKFYIFSICFFLISFNSISQIIGTDEKIEILGLAGQSADVISAASESDFTLEEIDQANSMKNKGITDMYILSVMKQHKKLSVSDIIKIKEYIDKGYPPTAINKSISEKPNFPSVSKSVVNEKKEETKPKVEEKELNNFFALNIGALFPVSKFSETNANSKNSGYASTGLGVGFNYQHYFIEYLGLSLTLQFHHNFSNVEELEKDAKTSLGSDYTLTGYEDNGLSTFNLGLGPALIYPLNEKKTLHVELKGNFGIALLYSHKKDITFYDNIYFDDYEATLSSGNKFNYFFDASLGLRYLVGEKTFLALHGGYYNSKLDKLEQTAKGYYNGQLDASDKIKTSQDIHNISLMLSIGAKF